MLAGGVSTGNLPLSMRRLLRPILVSPLLLAGCIHVKMDPIQVHATVDVNVRVERALEDFFNELDQESETITR